MKVDFAVRCSTGCWDNNWGNNYQIEAEAGLTVRVQNGQYVVQEKPGILVVSDIDGERVSSAEHLTPGRGMTCCVACWRGPHAGGPCFAPTLALPLPHDPSPLPGTMIGDDATTRRFVQWWVEHAVPRGSKLVYSSGRHLELFQVSGGR